MTVNELAQKLSLSTLACPDGERTVSGAYIGDLLSWVMGRAQCDNVWITIMSNLNIIAVASLADVSCIILAEGVTLEKSIVDTANQKGVNVFSTEKNAYEIASDLAQLQI